MLFNSFEFIFAFLPVVVLLVWAFGRFASFQAVVAVLVAASLFFIFVVCSDRFESRTIGQIS